MSTKKTKFARQTEKVDNTPLEIPVGFQRPPSLQEQIQRLVRVEISERAVNSGAESFEKSEDFGDESDDFDQPSSPHEVFYHPGLGKDVTRTEARAILQGEREADEQYKAYREKVAKEKREAAEERRKARKRRALAAKKRSNRS